MEYEYKGRTIELSNFGYIVFYHGDEIVFSSEEEAENFIDELEF